uniref:FACT complex subunit SSRP1 n=1 Tax=Ascaris suum TaxID=6253 RepID=F1KZ02_ASCSU
METAPTCDSRMEEDVRENDDVDLGTGKGAAEEAKKHSVTPLQNISNNASSEEVGHHNGDGDAPPAKRARKGATNEATSPQESATIEKNTNDEKAEGDALVTLLAADGIIGISPEGKFHVIINKEDIILKSDDGGQQYTIPIDSIGRIFVLPQENHFFVALALIAPLMTADWPTGYVVLELPLGKEVSKFEEKIEKSEQVGDGASGPVSGPINEQLTEAMPRLLSSLSGLDAEKSVLESSPSMLLSVVCTYDGKSGCLFPLEDGFFFLHKYPTHIAFSDVFKADFIDSKGSDKQSDLVLTMKDSTMVKFCNIEKNDFYRLDVFGIEQRIVEGGRRLRREAASGSKLTVTEDVEDSDDDDYLEDRAKVKEKEEGDESPSESDSEGEPLEEYESDVQDTTQEDIDEEVEEDEEREEDVVEGSNDQNGNEQAPGNEENADKKGVTGARKNVMEVVEAGEANVLANVDKERKGKESTGEGRSVEKGTESANKEEVGGQEKDSGSVGGGKGPEGKESVEVGAHLGSGMKEEGTVLQGCERAEES